MRNIRERNTNRELDLIMAKKNVVVFFGGERNNIQNGMECEGFRKICHLY